MVTNGDKTKAWNEIKDNVNAVNRRGYVRSVEDIKRKYITFKSEAKAKAAKIVTHSRQTGGGPPIDLTLDPVESLIVDNINPQLYRGIDGGIDTQMIESQSTDDIEFAIIDDNSETTVINESIEESFGTKPKAKKRKFNSVETESQLKTISDSVLDLEKEKIELKKVKLNLLRIELLLKTKSLANRGIDCSAELHELNDIVSQ